MKTAVGATTAILLGGTAFAQQNLGPTPMIGGVHVSCLGVPTLVARINDIGMAAPGQIILNPLLFEMPAPIQLFVYAHECGHHQPGIGSNEQLADCWAIRTGRDQGWLPPDVTGMIAAAFINSPGDWTHAPGQTRVQQMAACYNAP